MKTDIKKLIKEKEFDTVETFRAIKEKIASEIADLNLEQIQAYLKSKKLRLKD